MNRTVLALFLALPLTACGARVDLPDDPSSDAGSTSDSATTDSGAKVCEPSSCGPAPRSPSELCWDGSTGGFTGRCIEQAGGTCGWEFRECPPKPGSCVRAADCGVGMYCNVAVGACGAAGSCVKKPEGCDLSYAPVCGCDGKTYGNECAAKTAGATIAYKGECKPSPSGCGGSSGSACAPGQYCKFPDGMCPAPGSTGSCTPIPSGCPDVWSPVCGCDNKTYSNACDAASAKQSVAYNGGCAMPSTSCGGFGGSACPSSMYCDYPAGSFCGGADETGTCRPRPTSCSKEYKPVCGCDRKTYTNACYAAMAGIDVFKEGGC